MFLLTVRKKADIMIKRRKMKIVLDKQKLQEVITSFAEITRTNICFFDAEMNVLAELPQKMQPFCKRIRAAEGKLRQCLLSDETHRKTVKKLKKPLTYTCHAGITETMLPVIYDNEIAGYIIFGQYRRPENEAEAKTKLEVFCKNSGLSYPDMLAEYEKLPELSEDNVRAAVSMMELCIKYLCLENVIKIDGTSAAYKITKYLAENYRQDVSVEELCKKFFIGTKMLYRLVKEQTGMTVFGYVAAKRVKEAEELLLSSDKSVSEIATEVGYSDYNYFIKVFKKATGVTPLKYRKQNAR